MATKTKENNSLIKFTAAASFVLMVTVNALANILPINGKNTGEVSDSYRNLFAPAGITFAIWGVIYLLLALYVIFQTGLFQGKKNPVNASLLKKIGIYFSVSSMANAVWIFSWHFENIPLSMLLMLVILVCLIIIALVLKKPELSTREKLLLRLPFSIYFGWITVATIANATTLFVSLGWNGFGISETAWAVIIIITGMIIGAAAIIKFKDAAYGMVILWAYFGILIKHTSASGFNGQYPAVITTVLLCIALVLAAQGYVLISGGKKRANIQNQDVE